MLEGLPWQEACGEAGSLMLKTYSPHDTVPARTQRHVLLTPLDLATFKPGSKLSFASTQSISHVMAITISNCAFVAAHYPPSKRARLVLPHNYSRGGGRRSRLVSAIVFIDEDGGWVEVQPPKPPQPVRLALR